MVQLTEKSEIRKYMNIVEDADRPKTKHSDIEYEYAGKSKKATAEGDYDRVIAKLSAGKSGKFTKIGKQYKEIKRLSDQLNELKTSFNEDATRAIEELFPIEDDIYTRVVMTKVMVIKLGKAEKEHTVEETDFENYAAELEEHLIPELGDKLKAIKEKYKTVKVIAEKKPKLLTPQFIKEDSSGSFYHKLVKWIKNTVNELTAWKQDYDIQLDDLMQKIRQL